MIKENNKKINGGHFVDNETVRGDSYDCKNINIHSMPKRFLNVSSEDQKKAKGAGVLIFIGGGLVLIALSVFLYFYFFDSKESKIPVVDNDNSRVEEKSSGEINKEEVKKEEPDKNSEDKKNDEVSIEKKDEKISLIDENEEDENDSAEVEEISKEATTTIKKIEENKDVIVKMKEALDSDNDGLTDIEESILGSNVNNSDSDGDSYSDLSELLGLYNPAGNGGIMTNSAIEKYENGGLGYYIYHPKSWTVNSVGDDSSIIIKAGNNQFIQIIVQPNKDNKTIGEWYQENIASGKINSNQRIYKQGWSGVKNQDGMIVYLLGKDNNIFTLSYNLGVNNIVYYKNIFNMMINSLEMIGE